MGLDTQPTNKLGKLTSPDLQLRDSVALWGPLQISIVRHRVGTELGYQAGETAYQALAQHYGQDVGLPSGEGLNEMMDAYFALPRYRPRTITAKITNEWRAMFLLGWTSQMLQIPLFSSTRLPTESQLIPSGTAGHRQQDQRSGRR